MPDSSSSTQTKSADNIASIYQDLDTAEKTAGVLEQRLELLEKRLDDLLDKLETEAEAEATETQLPVKNSN
jgi:polyhydroxyalkanoate synthesis regulator phasin